MSMDRVARPIWIICVILAAIIASVVLWDAGQHLTGGLANAAGEELGRDFAYFWSGARLAVSGHTTEVYEIRNFFNFERSVFGTNAEFKFYGYPPTFLLLTAPLGYLPYIPAFVLWISCGTLLCAWLLAREVGWRWALPLSIGTPAAFLNFYAGQNGQFTAALFASGLAALKNHPVWAGVAFGLLSFKPQLGALIPVALIASRKWQTLMAGAVTCLVLASASWAVFGTEIWSTYLAQTSLQRMLLETESMNWPRMPTVFAALLILGADSTTAYVGQVISAAAAIIAVADLWRTGAPTESRFAGLVLGTFLVTPYAWDYDMVVLTFAIVWLVVAEKNWIANRAERIALITLIALPMVEVFSARLIRLPIAPVILWFALALIVRQSRILLGLSFKPPA